VKLFDERPIRIFDADAKAGRPRIAPGPAIDVRDDHR
jgi:hypothetical protein